MTSKEEPSMVDLMGGHSHQHAHCCTKAQYDHEVDVERRQLRHWVLKAFVATFGASVVVVVGMTAYSTLVLGDKYENTILQHVIKAIGEIIDAFD